MTKSVAIGWDVSHQEFTIEDHYYFSDLKREIFELGARVEEIRSLSGIFDYEVLVLNYPEKPFTRGDVSLVERYLEEGGRVVACGYYVNEDGVADSLNSLVGKFGLRINGDCVEDDRSNLGDDPLLLVTSRVFKYNSGVERLLFPCSASIDTDGERSAPIVLSEGRGGRLEDVLGAEVEVGGGRLILLGTCVFWDNWSIREFGNRAFSLNLLLG